MLGQLFKCMEMDVISRLTAYNEEFDRERVQEAVMFSAEGKISANEILDLLLPFKPDEETVLAVLLKESYCDEKITSEEVSKKFGQKVLSLIEGVKKLDDLKYAQNDRSSQLEILRMMFFAMAKDLRVVFISLIFRLYTLQHLAANMGDDERNVFARETLHLYVPVAARLGIYNIKSVLEDLAFKYSLPYDYDKIIKETGELENKFPVSIANIKEQLDGFFASNGVEAYVSGRTKGAYSTYKKLKKKGLSSVADLYDIFAMRVILPSKNFEGGDKEAVDHLYSVLGMIHSKWRPISKKFKDYIAVPKPNGYRSLHTVVLGLAPKDRDHPVEIQIRDMNMHRDAEYGVASHWLYKDAKGDGDEGVESRSNWIKGLERLRDIEEDSMKEVDLDIFNDRIFVLTPRGEVKDLPAGSCPVDFAYSIHTDIGHKCFMAKVDGKVVPLDYELENGQVVDILTKKDAQPRLQWLSMVKTSFARNKIKAWFSALNRDANIKEGRKILNLYLARIGKPLLDQTYSILRGHDGEKLSLANRETLVEEVGKGARIASDVIRRVYSYEESVVDKVVNLDLKSDIDLHGDILVGGESGLPVKIAACCEPKRGDTIIGYVTRGSSITIHKTSCSMIDGLDHDRVIFAGWKGIESGERNTKYIVPIKVVDVDRVGLIRDLSTVIANLGIGILDITIKQARGCLDEDYFLLEMDDINQFDVLVDKLEEVDGVVKVMKSDKVKKIYT